MSQACKFEEEYCIDLNQVLPIIAGQKQFDRKKSVFLPKSSYERRSFLAEGENNHIAIECPYLIQLCFYS